jgi:hypothetical protein
MADMQEILRTQGHSLSRHLIRCLPEKPRSELLDHVMVLNEEHLQRLLKEFMEGYYHRARPHQGLQGDTPVPSAKPEPAADGSRLVSIPVVGGLHHRYIRVAA